MQLFLQYLPALYSVQNLRTWLNSEASAAGSEPISLHSGLFGQYMYPQHCRGSS